jgi:hypothetical protein
MMGKIIIQNYVDPGILFFCQNLEVPVCAPKLTGGLTFHERNSEAPKGWRKTHGRTKCATLKAHCEYTEARSTAFHENFARQIRTKKFANWVKFLQNRPTVKSVVGRKIKSKSPKKFAPPS